MSTQTDLSSLAEACAKEITAHFELIGREGYVPCNMDENVVRNVLLRHLQPLAKDREDKVGSLEKVAKYATAFPPNIAIGLILTVTSEALTPKHAAP